MSEKVEVSFNSPQCGWMSIGFDDGTHEFRTTTAHAPHERALSELLQILTNLLDENSAQNEYVLHWNRNPEEFDFHFLREGETVHLEIYQYPSEQRETTQRKLVFAHTGETKDFCEAFYTTFSQLYRDRETDDFKQNWRQSFPLKDFLNFERRVKSYKP